LPQVTALDRVKQKLIRKGLEFSATAEQQTGVILG
jgi:hypothetical protein